MNPSIRCAQAVLILAAISIAVSCGTPERTRSRRPTGDELEAPKAFGDEREDALRPGDAPEERGPGGPSRPSAAAVARRALVLRSLGMISISPRPNEKASSATLEFFEMERQRMVTWLRREEIWETASAEEKTLLSTPIGMKPTGSLDPSKDWREELTVTLWALDEVKRMPEYDTPALGLSFLSRRYLPSVGTLTGDFIQNASLRPAGEIDHEKEKAEIWHWRALARDRIDRQEFPEGKELALLIKDLEKKAIESGFRIRAMPDGKTFFQELLRFSAFYAHQKGLIPRPIHEDFPMLGQKYEALTEKQFQRVREIAGERLHALKWLVGEGADWAAISLDE